jgi:hypothetical protein
VLPNVIDTTPRNRTPASTARVLEGFNPSLEISQVTEDSSLGLVGKAPSSIVSSPQIPVGRCPLTFTGIAPETSREIAVDQGNLTLTAKTPTRQLSNNLAIEVGQEKTSRVLHGQVPLISSDQSRILTPAAAALILTEQLLYLGRSLTVPARGAFLNGKVPLAGDFIRPIKFPGEADLTLAGQTPSIRLGPRFVLDEGSLTLAGQTVTLDQTRNHVRQPSKQELDLAGTTPVPNETRLRAPGAGRLAFGTKQKTLRPTIRLTRSRKEGARTRLVSLSTDYNLKMLYD